MTDKGLCVQTMPYCFVCMHVAHVPFFLLPMIKYDDIMSTRSNYTCMHGLIFHILWEKFDLTTWCLIRLHFWARDLMIMIPMQRWSMLPLPCFFVFYLSPFLLINSVANILCLCLLWLLLLSTQSSYFCIKKHIYTCISGEPWTETKLFWMKLGSSLFLLYTPWIFWACMKWHEMTIYSQIYFYIVWL